MCASNSNNISDTEWWVRHYKLTQLCCFSSLQIWYIFTPNLFCRILRRDRMWRQQERYPLKRITRQKIQLKPLVSHIFKLNSSFLPFVHSCVSSYCVVWNLSIGQTSKGHRQHINLKQSCIHEYTVKQKKNITTH